MKRGEEGVFILFEEAVLGKTTAYPLLCIEGILSRIDQTFYIWAWV